LTDAFTNELKRKVRYTEDGIPRVTTKFEALAARFINRALNGDLKAAALVMNAVGTPQSAPKDNLSPILSELRSISAKHELDATNADRAGDDSDPSETASPNDGGTKE
jgi:hypothetical protein